MTLACPCGSTAVTLVDDNGARYPETRMEHYECDQCGSQFRKVKRHSYDAARDEMDAAMDDLRRWANECREIQPEGDDG